jgi:N utilization substance protein B
MTSRRLIRVKVLQLLYAFTKKVDATVATTEKELFKSIAKSTDLYYHVFLLLVEIQRRAFLKIDIARNRKLASPEDLNPNTRFVDNPVLLSLAANRLFNTRVKNRLVSLADCQDVIDHLYRHLVRSEFYAEYMAKEEVSFDDHKQLVMAMISDLIAPDDHFDAAMEEKNIFWNDDLALVLSIAHKTIKHLRDDDEDDIFLALYDDDDEDFAKNLFRKCVLDAEDNVRLVDTFTLNWDIERVPDTEKIIMNMAVTELKHFPSIPVKVTFDEYIEIAKCYCSPKSAGFVNGVLDKALELLKEKGEIKKVGRGLIEE